MVKNQNKYVSLHTISNMKVLLDKSNQRLTANVLKEIIYSFLMNRDGNGIIGSEVMYGSSRRVADMVFISNSHSYAIEIKSEFDSTSRLEGQLAEYLALFDYVIIFSAPNHIKKIKTVIPDNVGLYSICENGIEKLRQEKINRHAQKSEMLFSIPSAIVKFDFSVKGKLTSDEIRAAAMKHSLKYIHDYFVNYYKEKLLHSSYHIDTKIPKQEMMGHDDYIII